MGRIKGKAVRSATIDVLKRYKDKFTDNFEANKKLLDSLIITNKAQRNKIAGYVTQLAREKRIEAFMIENSGS